MKTILSSRRDHYLAKFSIFLIALALIVGMVGCVPVLYKLSISSTEGGKVTSPGEGTFSYLDKGKVVNLVAKPDEGYRFVYWTGDVDDIADVENGTTNITMNGNYTITANFDIEILEITNWHELDDIRNNLVSHHILMNDLDSTTAGYNETASPTANNKLGWEPIGTSNSDDQFSGSFNGQGNEIKDLFITRTDPRYVGLFGYVGEGGVVEDVGVVNATVTGGDYVGGLVGENAGNVSNSYSTGSVTGEDGVGGLVGENTGIVSNSNSTVSVIGKDGVGGLVGGNEKGTLNNSYSTGNVSGDENIGGLVGENQFESNVINSYSTGSVTGDVGVGGLVGSNDKSTVSNSHYNYDEVLVMINGQAENIITIGALYGVDFDKWLANDKFLNVTKRLFPENGYYEINNVTDFKELLAFGQNRSLRFTLTSDLDLGNEPNFYIPYFAGKFYGNNHIISNSSFNFDFAYNVGLFGCLAPGGKVTQVGVENVNITGASYVGGLVGVSWEGIVSESYSTGSVSGDDYIGGLVGCNCEESTVKTSNSTCSVSGDEYVGGLVGCNDYKVENSSSSGNVKGNVYVGGLVGHNGDTVLDSHSTGSVSGDEYVGGLVGCNDYKVENSSSSGNVKGNVYVGGLVGKNGDTVEQCSSRSNVKGDDSVGGLVGLNDGKWVQFSYSTGNVTGKKNVGGLVGRSNKGTVSNSYSTGNVTGNLNVGGLVGSNYKESTVNSSYSIGRVSDGEDVGGLVGRNYNGTVSRSLWDIETSLQSTSAAEGEGKAEGKSTEEMKSEATFLDTGWDIVKIEDYVDENWYIDDGKDYPRLGWQL